jgi:hypothetical protein
VGKLSMEQIVPDRGSQRVVIASVWPTLALLISAPAVADAPCPPQIVAVDGGTVISDSKVCPAPATESDTPDYQDPLASCSGLTGRRVVPVASATALQQAMTNASCGDTIQLAPGSYNATLSISKSCGMTAPVIIQGAANFQSTINAQVTVTGQSTILKGINFSGQNTRVTLSGKNNKVLGNKFRDWLAFAALSPMTGSQGEIAYNEFSQPHPWLANEASDYPLRMGIRTNEKDASSFHFGAWVHHNYFHDFPAKPNPAVYSSGQADAIEVCVTPTRADTIGMKTGWYIERNLVQRHLQGHGIIDLKCGGSVVRYNTVIDSPGGRIDQRGGSYSTIEGNWLENSGGMTIRGGYHRILGNYTRGGIGITLAAGNTDWNVPTATGADSPRAVDVLVAGNDSDSLTIGKAYSAADDFPVLNTIVQAHVGAKPELESQSNTKVSATTAVRLSTASRLTSNEVGPAAMNQAPASYLACRNP